MEADAEPEEEPWELKLERALLSRLAPAPDDDEEEEEDAQIIAPNEEDRSAQLDELMALKSIFGDDLRGPAAAVAASMCAGDDDDETIGAFRFDLTIRLDREPRRIDVRIDGAPAATVVYPSPVALHAIFPRDYPSASPPLLALTASWLPPEATDAACDTMAAMWTPGAPAVFEMAGWLAESSVDECFAPGGVLNLEGCNLRGGRKPRAEPSARRERRRSAGCAPRQTRRRRSFVCCVTTRWKKSDGSRYLYTDAVCVSRTTSSAPISSGSVSRGATTGSARSASRHRRP